MIEYCALVRGAVVSTAFTATTLHFWSSLEEKSRNTICTQ